MIAESSDWCLLALRRELLCQIKNHTRINDVCGSTHRWHFCVCLRVAESGFLIYLKTIGSLQFLESKRVKRSVGFSSRHKPGVDQSLVERDEGGIVQLGERTPAWKNIAIALVTDGLEFPQSVNPLQVAHMQTLVSEDAINAVIDPAERHGHCGLLRIWSATLAKAVDNSRRRSASSTPSSTLSRRALFMHSRHWSRSESPMERRSAHTATQILEQLLLRAFQVVGCIWRMP